MADNTTDVQSCLEYLEKHVEDDEEVEVILYQEDSTSDDNEHENGDDSDDGSGENDKVDQYGLNDIDELVDDTVSVDCQALSTSAQSKFEKPKISSVNSTPTTSKPTNKSGSAFSKIPTTENPNTKNETSNIMLIGDGKKDTDSIIYDSDETNRNIDDPHYQDMMNDGDYSDYVDTEANNRVVSPTPPVALVQYQCMKCAYNTNKKPNFLRHLKIHSDKLPYTCSTCERSFKRSDYLRKHLRAHHDLKTCQIQYQCRKCVYNTNDENNFKRHLKLHSDEYPHNCSLCGKSFKFKNYLTRHLRHHPKVKTYQCADCDKAFVTSSALSCHVKEIHRGSKPIKCTECDFSTVYGHMLNRHMIKHKNERRHQCSQCTYTHYDAYNVKVHMQTHTGEKPYECDICHARYTRPYALKRHLKTHQCTLCPTILRNKDHLYKHMKERHNTTDSPNKQHRHPQCEQPLTLEDPNPKCHQEKIELNLRRTTRCRSDGTLVSKGNENSIGMDAEVLSEEEKEGYKIRNEDGANLIRCSEVHAPYMNENIVTKFKAPFIKHPKVENVVKETMEENKPESVFSVIMINNQIKEEELEIKDEYEGESEIKYDNPIRHLKTHDPITQLHEENLKLSSMICNQRDGSIVPINKAASAYPDDVMVKEEVEDDAVENREGKDEEIEYDNKMLKHEEFEIKEEQIEFVEELYTVKMINE